MIDAPSAPLIVGVFLELGGDLRVHIGLCSPTWPPAKSANGIVSYVAAVRDHFISEGHRVSVFAHGCLYDNDDRPVPLTEDAKVSRLRSLADRVGKRLARRDGGLPHVGRAIATEILAAHRKAPLDVIEMEDSFGWCGIVQRMTQVPVVTRLHGPHFLKPERLRGPAEVRMDRSKCRAEARAVRSARMITAPTNAIMQATCEAYGRPADRLHSVIANPIRFDPNGRHWQLDRCERDSILMVGRFDFWKGADTMLIAFEQLLRRRPSARLTLVGPDLGIEVTNGQTIGFEAYVRATMAPEARERVDFRGTLTPAEIAELRLAANVTVIASRCENFPYVLLESFAAGCPVISTDWAGSDEIVTDGETGLLTPVGEPAALAERLDWLFDHPLEAAEMAARGRRRCARDFSVQKVGGQLLDCYASAIRHPA